MDLIIFLVIGAVSGWLAGLIRRGEGFGLFGNIIVGVAGSFLGGLLFRLIGIQDTYFIGTIIISVIGSVILLALVNMFTGRKV